MSPACSCHGNRAHQDIICILSRNKQVTDRVWLALKDVDQQFSDSGLTGTIYLCDRRYAFTAETDNAGIANDPHYR